VGTYRNTTGDCADSGDFELMLNQNGTASFAVKKTRDCRKGEVKNAWQSGAAGMATHKDGAFTINFSSYLVVKGTYDASGFQGSGTSTDGAAKYEVSGSRVSLSQPR